MAALEGGTGLCRVGWVRLVLVGLCGLACALKSGRGGLEALEMGCGQRGLLGVGVGVGVGVCV